MRKKRPEVPRLDELIPGRPATETDANLEGEGPPAAKPEQVTVYFSPETVKLIETARYHLRMEDGIKATKSALVEACVVAAIGNREWLKEQLARE